MGYLIAAILVVLIAAAGVSFFVLNATRKQRRASAADSEYGDQSAIVAPDDNTPLGDTDQLAGEHSREGHTVRPPESGRQAGRGSPPSGGDGGTGGEGEGSRPVVPESERVANRPR